MTGRKLVPRRRFRGFCGEWENVLLSSLMDFSNGINAPKESYGKGRKMISVMDILSSNPLVYECIINSVQVDASIEERNKVEYGDIIFVRSSETLNEVGIAKAYLQEQYALYSGFSIRGKKKDIFDAHFVELLLNSKNRNQIERKSGGSTRYNISQSILNQISILIASIKEQTAIGDFFKQLDNLIRLQQKKLDKLKALRQAYLFEMFPADGEKVPKRRFKGFRGDWVDEKLENIADFYGGGTPSSNNSDYWSGNIPWISSSDVIDGNIYSPLRSRFITEEAIQKSATKLLPANSLLIVSRVGLGKLVISNEPICTSQDFTNLTSIKADVVCLTYIMYLRMNREASNSQGTSIKGITAKEIKQYSIKLPETLAEQTAIGGFFRHLDDQIHHQQRKLEKLQDLKKAYLNELFV